MIFNSIDYLIFFPIVVLIFFLIPKKIRYIWLLVCSYYFYMCWNAEYAILILISTVVTYIGSLVIYKYKFTDNNLKTKFDPKFVLALVIIINIGILVYFKYSNLILDSIQYVAKSFGASLTLRSVDVLLPVGISFYTFQALSYSIDVYRGDIVPEKNLLKYALFVSFFPQLVAGPIERSSNLLPQIQNLDKNKFKLDNVYQGLLTIFWGLFIKMVIADRISPLVDTVFKSYYRYGCVELVFGIICFTVQLYCDFYGYSVIAMGSAKIMGITLMENFDAPYFSSSIKEFWRRWHISLSSWFKDYLFIPLGGSRKGVVRKYINILIIFTVSGLWHGAAMRYILWGFITGIYQVIGDILEPLREKSRKLFNINTECFSYRFGRILGTYFLFCISVIIFRADNIKVGIMYIIRMFTNLDIWRLSSGAIYKLGLSRSEMNIFLVATLVLFLFDYLKYKKNIGVVEFVTKQNYFFQGVFTLTLLMSIIIFGIYGPLYDAQAFIYFQF